MLPEGTKTCKICGHVLWRDEEKDVCESCKHDLRDLIEQKPRRWMVRYYDMYPLDPQDRLTIKRAVVTAKTSDEAADIMAVCGKEIIDVELYNLHNR